jgi:uncharacterized protein with PIN domain
LARLYADENFPFPTVEALRLLGHDVLTPAETNQAGLGIADEDVLAFAHSERRALLTHNRKDFRNLHKAGQPHSGMVLCTADSQFDSLAARISETLAQHANLEGQVIRVTRRPSN